MRHCKQKPEILSYQSFVTKESSLVNDEICGKKRISWKQKGALFQSKRLTIIELAIKICFFNSYFCQYWFHCYLCSTIFVDLENSILRIHKSMDNVYTNSNCGQLSSFNEHLMSSKNWKRVGWFLKKNEMLAILQTTCGK